MTLIKHRSDTEVSDRCQIEVDPMIFTTRDVAVLPSSHYAAYLNQHLIYSTFNVFDINLT